MMLFFLNMINTEEGKNKFELIYDKYCKLMFYIANQILNDNSLAEDAVHDAFVNIIKNLHKIKDINCNKTKSFIAVIVRNCSINMYNYRKSKSYIPLDKIEYMLDDNMDVENNIGTDFDKFGSLGGAIMKLPVIYRDIIILKFLHELTNQEIASLLNINEANVRKRIERAKRKIQNILEKECSDAV